METQYDAIVIGAGVGGLASAGLLARAGLRTLVVEKHSVVGGCCSTFRRAHFIFDAAVHAIGGCYPGDIIQHWCQELHVGENELQFIDLHPFYELDIVGERLAIPANLDELAAMLSGRFPRDSDAIYRCIAEIKSEGKLAVQANLQEQPANSMVQAKLGRLSWADYLAGRFSEPEIATVLSSLCIYGGTEPQQASTLFMMAMYYSYHLGAYYPQGSTQRFADALANAVRRWGGVVRRKATVERILQDARGRACGVRLVNGEELRAPIIISNADVSKTLCEWLEKHQLPASWQRRLKRAEYSPSAVVLYLAAREDQWKKGVSSHETFYLPNWQQIGGEHFYYRPGQPETHFAFSLSAPSFSDPSLAPANHHVLALTALAKADFIEGVREEQGKAYLERDMLAHAERLLPGIGETVLYRELATPRTFERYTNNGQGAIYGWAKNTQHWTNGLGRQSPIAGLYLTGHWTQGVHGIYGAFLSGVALAQTLLRERDETKSYISCTDGFLPAFEAAAQRRSQASSSIAIAVK